MRTCNRCGHNETFHEGRNFSCAGVACRCVGFESVPGYAGWPEPAKNMSAPEPAPKANAHPAVWSLVQADMRQRDEFGRAKYKTPLQPHNGRDPLTDLYQELLDAAVYCRQAIYERDGK